MLMERERDEFLAVRGVEVGRREESGAGTCQRSAWSIKAVGRFSGRNREGVCHVHQGGVEWGGKEGGNEMTAVGKARYKIGQCPVGS